MNEAFEKDCCLSSSFVKYIQTHINGKKKLKKPKKVYKRKTHTYLLVETFVCIFFWTFRTFLEQLLLGALIIEFWKYRKKKVYFYFTDLRPATLLNKWPWHRFFLVNFAKFLRIPFLQNTSGRLLLNIIKSTSGNVFKLFLLWIWVLEIQHTHCTKNEVFH